MSVTATLHRFQIELADIDRGVYESLDLRVARHPSEDEQRVVVRVLARAIAHEEGLEFGRGLSNVDEPALWTCTNTGEVTTWIDVGIPAADRLHRASKRARKVMVFTHKSGPALHKAWSSREVHHPEQIEIVQLDATLVETLADGLERAISWYVTIQDGSLSVSEGERSVAGAIARRNLSDFLSTAP